MAHMLRVRSKPRPRAVRELFVFPWLRIIITWLLAQEIEIAKKHLLSKNVTHYGSLKVD